MIPNPAKYWTSTYQAEIDQDLCKGCKTCIQRCQVDAITIKNEKAAINLRRCIGCGNCVITCPNKAIYLIEKKISPSVPEDSEDLYEMIFKTS
jgi:NAD-dependent dihydropyrimidine dehydrogenase PreA subunit